MGEARTIHSLHAIGAASRLLSCLPSIPPVGISLPLVIVARARAREYGTRPFIIAYVTNRLSPRDRHWLGSSNLEAELCSQPARVSLVMPSRETTSHLTETHTSVFKRTSAKLNRKNAIQTNRQYEANCALFARNWINKARYVYAWKDSGDDCLVNMVGQLVIAMR